jgi:hypothetical protein
MQMPSFPSVIIKNIVLSPLCCFGTLPKDHLTIFLMNHCWAAYPLAWSLHLSLQPDHTVLIVVAL